MLKIFKRNWTRLHGLRGFVIMPIYRYGNFVYYKVKIPVVRQILWLFYRVIDMVIVRSILNCEFPAQAKIGNNLSIPHGGNGVILGVGSTIGNNVVIFHQVTIGTNLVKGPGAPTICDDVYIGCGAKILGNITIGQGAKIGANATVLKDVPAGATAVGIPAKLIVNSKQVR